MSKITDSFLNALDSIIAFIPNLISAIILLIVAWLIAVIVKTIIVKGLNAVGFEKWLEKKGLTESGSGKSGSEGLIQTFGKLAYFIIFLLFLPSVFDALNMTSVSTPIKNMMGSVLDFLPRIIVAIVILVVGLFIAKVLGTLVKNLLTNLNVSKYNRYVNFGENKESIDIPSAAGWVISTIIGLFFVVESLNTVNLEVLNTIGEAIIGYLPLVISAAIILLIGFIGGNLLSKLIKKSTGNVFVSEIVKYLVIIVSVFMTLDQLNFAQSIVNVAFLLILGAVAVAFAIAFGIGGRGFAEKQLNSLSNRIEEDKRNPDYGNTDEPLFGSKQNNSYNNYSDAHYDNNHYDNNHYDNAHYEDQHYNNASANDHFEHSEFDADQREIERRQAEQKSDYVRNDEVEERREQRRERRRDPRDRH